MAATFALPVPFPLPKQEIDNADFVLPSGPIVPPVFFTRAEERKYWDIMNLWYIPPFGTVVQKLERKFNVRGQFFFLHDDPIFENLNAAEARELQAPEANDDYQQVNTIQEKYCFLRSELEWLTRLARVNAQAAASAPRMVKRLIEDVSSGSDTEDEAEIRKKLKPLSPPDCMCPFVLPAGDLDQVVFVLPIAPIVPPVFSHWKEEYKYWDTMGRWYISNFQSAVLALERELKLRSFLVSFNDTFFDADQKAEIAALTDTDPVLRKVKKSVIKLKYVFRRDEYVWLTRLDRVKTAQGDSASAAL